MCKLRVIKQMNKGSEMSSATRSQKLKTTMRTTIHSFDKQHFFFSLSWALRKMPGIQNQTDSFPALWELCGPLRKRDTQISH